MLSARVAELADALDLGSSPHCRIGVRVPSLAPIMNIHTVTNQAVPPRGGQTEARLPSSPASQARALRAGRAR